jgi:hypothetical protein
LVVLYFGAVNVGVEERFPLLHKKFTEAGKSD